MTTIAEKQQTILRSIWDELEADGPVTLERLNEKLSSYIAWDEMPANDAAHVLGVALPRIEKSIAGVGVAIAKELKGRQVEPNEWRELMGRQLQIAAEALAVVTSQDVWNMRCLLNDFVNKLNRDGVSYSRYDDWLYGKRPG